jgi:excisionase family DNA binding protein
LSEYLTTRELAALLRIKERKVYDLASSGEVPCTRVTGKLLFARESIDAWLSGKASGGGVPPERQAVVGGSHDPLLDWALRESRCGLATTFDSSLDGLEMFRRGESIAAGLHVYDADANDWNTPLVEAQLGDSAIVLVGWAKRKRGLITAANPASPIRELSDLRGKRMVPRQAEAGSQILLEILLERAGIDRGSVDWTPLARSELDAVTEVVDGQADACFGLADLARQHGLEFHPVIEERYDLLVDRRAWFSPAWQTFIAFCQSPDFSKRASRLGGYDVSDCLRVRFNGRG